MFFQSMSQYTRLSRADATDIGGGGWKKLKYFYDSSFESRLFMLTTSQ